MTRFHCVLLKQSYVLNWYGREEIPPQRAECTRPLHTPQSAVLWQLPGQAVLTRLSVAKGEETP